MTSVELCGTGSMTLGTTARLELARYALTVGGISLLWASAAVYLDLYATGYRRIPTIGTLFLLQGGIGVGLGVAVAEVAGQLGGCVRGQLTDCPTAGLVPRHCLARFLVRCLAVPGR